MQELWDREVSKLTSPCFLEENKPQKVFRFSTYCDAKCQNCHSDFKPKGRNSRIIRTTTNFPGVGMDHMWSCITCAKTYKQMLNIEDKV